MKISKQRNKGFTIVEILTVVVIMIVLLTAAMPGWRNFVQNNQAAAIASKLYIALALARTTAIQSGHIVILCPLTQPAGTTCQNITQWDAWATFMDKDDDNALDTGGTGENVELVKYYRDQPAGVIVSTVAGPIAFNAAGFSTVTTDRVFNILPPGCVGSNGRQITVMPSGNIRLTIQTCP